MTDTNERNGYALAVNDLYKILKGEKDLLSSSDLQIVQAMMTKEVERFMPKDKNLYDELPNRMNENIKISL